MVQSRAGAGRRLRDCASRTSVPASAEATPSERFIVAITERHGRASSQASGGLFLIGCGPGAAGAMAGRRGGRAATLGAAARAAGMAWVLRMLAPPALGRAGAWAAPSWAAGAWPRAARRPTEAPALGFAEVFGPRFLRPRRGAWGLARLVPRRRIRAPGRCRSGPPRRSGRSPPGAGGGTPRPDLPLARWLCARKTARPAVARSPGGTDRSGGR